MSVDRERHVIDTSEDNLPIYEIKYESILSIEEEQVNPAAEKLIKIKEYRATLKKRQLNKSLFYN